MKFLIKNITHTQTMYVVEAKDEAEALLVDPGTVTNIETMTKTFKVAEKFKDPDSPIVMPNKEIVKAN